MLQTKSCRALLGALMLTGLGLSHAAYAATLTVTGLADSGAGTLRAQIAAAAPGDTTNFSVTGTITLGSPLPTLSINDVAITEGNSGTKNIAFTVTRSGDTSGAITFNYNTANDTAAAPGDYTAVVNGSGVIAAGATTGTFNIPIKGDKLVEANETFTVTISNPTGATITTATGSGTITNDDNAPVTAPFAASTWAGRAIINRPTAATDADGNAIAYSAGTTAPTHGTLDGVLASDGLFLYTPDNTGYTGDDTFTLNASDGANTTPLTVTVTISAAPAPGTLIYTSVGASDCNAVGATSFANGYNSLLLGKENTMYGAGTWALSNRGVSGFTTADLLRVVGGKRVLDLAVADAPRAFTLWIGPNDVKNFALAHFFVDATEPEIVAFLNQFGSAYTTVLTALTGALGGSPAGIVTANIPKIGNLPAALAFSVPQRAALNDLCRRTSDVINAAAVGKAPVVDLYTGSDSALAGDTAADGFHPSDQGYQKLADGFWLLLRPQLNRLPVAVAQTLSTPEGSNLNGTLTASDPDLDEGALTLTVNQPAAGKGSVVFNAADNTFTYSAPNADYNGDGSFTFTAANSTSTSSAGTITVTVTPVNDAPVAVDDDYSTNFGTKLTIAAPGVLNDDSDVDLDALSVADNDTGTAAIDPVTAPTHGTLVLKADGSFTYTPTLLYVGDDSFTYKATDGSLSSNEATVMLHIAANTPPVAVDDSTVTDEDTFVDIGVIKNDTDLESAGADLSVKAGSIANVTGGTAVLQADNRTVRFTPTLNANDGNTPGGFSFTYKTTDGNADSPTAATVTITVNAVNDAPTSLSLSNNSIAENAGAGAVVGTLTASAAEGDALTYSLPEGRSSNLLFTIAGDTLQAKGSLNFEKKNSYGVFVRVMDAAGLSLDKAFTISVTNTNDAPVLDSSGDTQIPAAGSSVAELLATGANRAPISDEDAGALRGIAIAGVDNMQGRWQYSLNGGATWLLLGAPSSNNARLLVVDGSNTRVRYVLKSGSVAPVVDKLRFFAWDQSSGTNGGLADASASLRAGKSAFSLALESARVVVSAGTPIPSPLPPGAGPQASAFASSDSIELHFSGAIPASGFAVTVNGASVKVQSAVRVGQAVTLLLAEGALKTGDKVGVSWKDGAASAIAE